MAYKRLLVLTITACCATHAARAQSFQTSGSDVLPGVANGKLMTGAHLDATGVDVPNVRVFGYAFQQDPNDPYFTQDPGFNAPAAGLPAGSIFGFNILSGLGYWSGVGQVNFTAPPAGETLLYNFGINNRTIGGATGAQAGFTIGTVASNGAIHKHLNAFLQGSAGTSDPSTGGTFSPGIYETSFGLTDGGAGVIDSDPIYLVYDNGVDAASLDRAKFRLRNYSAPGTQLAGTVTNMIGLSPQPGEANLATGGAVTITGGSGSYRSEVDPLTSHQGVGSVALSHVGSEGPTLVMLWLSGADADVHALINSLDNQPGYDVAAADAPATDPLYASIHSLEAGYPGFGALVSFDPTADNGGFTWDFSGSATRDVNGGITGFPVTVTAVAAVPEPSLIALPLACAALVWRRHRRAAL